jgi:hypothetical protein
MKGKRCHFLSTVDIYEPVVSFLSFWFVPISVSRTINSDPQEYRCRIRFRLFNFDPHPGTSYVFKRYYLFDISQYFFSLNTGSFVLLPEMRIYHRFFQGFGSVFIFSGSGSRVRCWIPIRIRIRIQSGSRALMTKN